LATKSANKRGENKAGRVGNNPTTKGNTYQKRQIGGRRYLPPCQQKGHTKKIQIQQSAKFMWAKEAEKSGKNKGRKKSKITCRRQTEPRLPQKKHIKKSP